MPLPRFTEACECGSLFMDGAKFCPESGKRRSSREARIIRLSNVASSPAQARSEGPQDAALEGNSPPSGSAKLASKRVVKRKVKSEKSDAVGKTRWRSRSSQQ